jgi:Acetyltransferase (GNAT) domain
MSEGTADYTFVRTSMDNIHLLVPLYNRTFGKNVDATYLQKKYNTRWTTNKQFFGYLALNAKGEAVAHHTGIPFLFRFGDKEVLAAHSCDSLTSEELRGKGFFTLMGKMTDEMLKQEGFQFIFGYANENSLPAATKKLGWQFMGSLTGFKIPVRTIPLEKICRRFRFPYRAYLKFVDLVFRKNKTTDLIPNSCIEGENGGIVRDEAFYAYRCFSFNRRVKVGGVNVWFKLMGQLCIGDIERVEEEALLQMIKKLKRKCFWLGINEIIFQVSPGTYHEALFAKHFPSFVSWATLYNNFNSDVDFSKLKLTFGDLDSF